MADPLDTFGELPGELKLDPRFPTKGVARPLAPGEYLNNPDGSWSNEMTWTVPVNGKPSLVPGLWVINGKATHVSEDQATSLAEKSGLNFQSFPTEEAANQAADARESMLQGKQRGDTSIPSLWTGSMAAPTEPSAYQNQLHDAYSQGHTYEDIATHHAALGMDPPLRPSMDKIISGEPIGPGDLTNTIYGNPMAQPFRGMGQPSEILGPQGSATESMGDTEFHYSPSESASSTPTFTPEAPTGEIPPGSTPSEQNQIRNMEQGAGAASVSGADETKGMDI